MGQGLVQPSGAHLFGQALQKTDIDATDKIDYLWQLGGRKLSQAL